MYYFDYYWNKQEYPIDVSQYKQLTYVNQDGQFAGNEKIIGYLRSFSEKGSEESIRYMQPLEMPNGDAIFFTSVSYEINKTKQKMNYIY